MTQFRNHYENLHVSETAPISVIKSAYKTLCQNYHPDKNIGNPQAHQLMQSINAAYVVLSNPIKRQQHDHWISENKNGFKSSKASNTFKRDNVQKESNQNSYVNNDTSCDSMHTKNIGRFYLSKSQFNTHYHNWIA
ncbi:J domain-containing protein [Methylomonas sp. AM2-LC]|uniref:J domain-containing protein n=1 Tax=Methylomonas sp. AM2-LC TaxID=3153301 RepID=UPI003264D86A